MEKKGIKKILELISNFLSDSITIILKTDNTASEIIKYESIPGASKLKLEKLFSDLSKIKLETLNKLETIDTSNFKLPQQNSLLKTYEVFRTNDLTFTLVIITSEESFANCDIDRIQNYIEILSDRIAYEIEIYQKFFEPLSNINTVIYSINVVDGLYHFISPSVKNLFGMEPEEVAHNKTALLRKIVPEYFEKYHTFIDKLKKGENAVYEYQVFDKDKKRRYVRHFGNPIIHDNKVKRIVGIIDDITQEKQIFDQLQKSEEKFKLLIETASDLILSLNSFGYVALVNKNGAKSLGYSPNEILGRHFLELIDETTKSDIADAFQKILSSEKVSHFEATLVDKFDHQLIFEFQASPTIDDGVISGMLAIGRDVTRRRKDEEKVKELNNKLIEANRIISIERDRAKQQITVLEELNKLKNDFISRVSHEFRTPLASIVGFAETISSDVEMPHNMVSEFSNIILTEGKRLAKLINDVLDFSKIDNEKTKITKTDCDIISILKKLADSYQKQASDKKIKLTSEIPEAEITIHADCEMISKTFGYIIENALHFTKADGRVTVIAQDFLKEVEVIVNDTGIGISEEDLPNIFDKFSKVTRPGMQTNGAGLGLAYVKQAVDLHYGLIQVRSEVDKGTTFIIRLPKKKSQE